MQSTFRQRWGDTRTALQGPVAAVQASLLQPEAAPWTGEARLAIMSPDFYQVSQTFIYDDVRMLAPDRTVLLCSNGLEAARFGYPVLSEIKPEFIAWGTVDGWAKTVLQRVRRRFGRALNFDDRMRLAAFLKTQRVTVMLAEYGSSGVLAGDVCERLGIPLHVRFHGLDASAQLRYPTVRRRYRRLFGQASSIICVSHLLAERLVEIGCPERLIAVLPCGVEIERFPPGQPEPGRVVALGRLVEKKAPHLTIRAFAAIAGRFPAARLDVIGDGPLRERCEAEVAEHGLGTRVTLHGAQPHSTCGDLLRRAAVFAQHSVTAPNGDVEGSPVALAEAMATGLPVVSTRHSGISDAVIEGVTGFLVDEEDVDGMASHLACLLDHPDLAARMGRAGRARASEVLNRERTRARLRAMLGLPEPREAADPAVRRGGAGMARGLGRK